MAFNLHCSRKAGLQETPEKGWTSAEAHRLGKNPKELRGNKEHSNSAPETLLILRLRKLFRLLPIRAVVLGLCLITDWNGVATFEPAMKVNVGAALRAKRADYERGRLSTHRTRTNRLFGFMFTGAIVKRSGGHGFSR
jgi:hypothetical protein